VPEPPARTFNLLQSPWIPVRRRSGRLDWITPAQIAEVDDPPVSIETSRPDFDGGLWQFLIGLLQTLWCPEDEETWGERYGEPPTVDELNKAFLPALDAFWLDGPGPRYMQETGLERFEADEVSIQDVLGEALAARLFFKPEVVDRLGLRAAAMALTTLQMHAWGGGRGYKTALRGAGALTTLLVARGETIFRNAWLNVLSKDDWAVTPGDTKLPTKTAFPWVDSPRVDEKKDLLRVPQKSHPAVHYWAMPRRAWLCFLPGGRCDLLDVGEPLTAATVLRRPYGLDYQGAWLHPLSPHQRDPKDGVLYPARVPDHRIPYREWPSLTLGQRQKSGEPDTAVPAAVVHAYRLRNRARTVRGTTGEPSSPVSLKVFGYQMPAGQAKVFGWLEQETPLLSEDEAEARRLAPHAARLVAAAEAVRASLVRACREALRRRAEDIDYKASVLQGLSRAFWSGTEGAFFDHLQRIRPLLAGDDPSVFEGIKLSWLAQLQKVAMRLFAEVSQEAAQFSATDIARVARAHNKLRSETRPQVPWLREALDLPPLDKGPAGGAKPGKEAKTKEKKAAAPRKAKKTGDTP